MVTIFSKKNRRLHEAEAVAEGAETLCKDLDLAQSQIQRLRRLSAFPSDEEIAAVLVDLEVVEICLKNCLTAAPVVRSIDMSRC